MNAYILVIDGLGMWNYTQASTFQRLKQKMGFDTKKVFPCLYQLGLGEAECGLGNLMMQLSDSVGSMEGHREMMGYVTTDSWFTLKEGIPEIILNKLASITGISMIGNVQGRGKYIIPVYWEQHISTGKPIVYTGLDSTISIACRRKVESLENYSRLLLTELKKNGTPVRKVIIRQYNDDFSNLSERKEFFLTVDLKIRELPFRRIVVNSKIFELFQYGDKVSASKDSEAFDYLLLQSGANNTLFFFNLGDFDKYAHMGMLDLCYNTLLKVDKGIECLLSKLSDKDVLIITSDHGVQFDESDLSSSHVKECTLLLMVKGRKKYFFHGIKSGHLAVRELLLGNVDKFEIEEIGWNLDFKRC